MGALIERRGGGSEGDGEVRDILSEHAFPKVEAPVRELQQTELVTRVEVMVTKGGSISSYRVVESSGNLAHDGMVLSLFCRLASEGPGGEDRGPSEGARAPWAVRTRFEGCLLCPWSGAPSMPPFIRRVVSTR